MNSIFIIAHVPLASALRACALHVFPEAHAHIVAFDVQPDLPADESQASANIKGNDVCMRLGKHMQRAGTQRTGQRHMGNDEDAVHDA